MGVSFFLEQNEISPWLANYGMQLVYDPFPPESRFHIILSPGLMLNFAEETKPMLCGSLALRYGTENLYVYIAQNGVMTPKIELGAGVRVLDGLDLSLSGGFRWLEPYQEEGESAQIRQAYLNIYTSIPFANQIDK